MKGRVWPFAAAVMVAAGMLLGVPGGEEFGVVAPDGTWTPEAWMYLPYVVAVLPTKTPRPAPGPPGQVVVITEVFYKGVNGPGEPDEYVEIRSDGTVPAYLQGWTLRDVQDHLFTFPMRGMAPGTVCRVYTNEVHPESCGFSFGSETEIWDNDGDCARLRNAFGKEVDVWCYGDSR